MPVAVLERRGRFDVGFLPRLVGCLRGADVVHAWLTPAVLFGLLAARLARVPRFRRLGAGLGVSSAIVVAPAARRVREPAPHPMRWRGRELGGGARLPTPARCSTFGDTRRLQRARERWPPPGRPREVVRAELGAGRHVPVVLVAASFTPKKDHEDSWRRWSGSPSSTCAPLTLLAGTGPLEPTLRRTVDRLGLTSQVRFLGHRSDVADLLCASDVAVLPSCEREGCSNFLMEAMSLAVPIVTTDAGGSNELITRGMTGLVVPARRPRALADAIAEVLTSSELADRLGETAARAAAARFAPKRMIAEMETLYEKWIRARMPIVSSEGDDHADGGDRGHRGATRDLGGDSDIRGEHGDGLDDVERTGTCG